MLAQMLFVTRYDFVYFIKSDEPLLVSAARLRLYHFSPHCSTILIARISKNIVYVNHMKAKRLLAVLRKLPDVPGIYLFYNAQKELVYAGKATSLRSRVRSYFRGRITPRPIEEMIHEVANIKWKETDSALEAVIWESIYIKKFLPRYNVLGKDNKSWNYIIITKDEFPKVLTMRQHELETLKHKNLKTLKQFAKLFGPYPGLNTKAAMKLLRRLFHFSNCETGTRPCLYYQMGQCLGICAGEISAREYREKVIRPLVTFLRGKKKPVIKMFEIQMRAAGQAEHFEEAARIRDQLKSLQRIQDVALLNKSFIEDVRNTKTTKDAKYEPEKIRIEGYDISNIGATEKVGSMVVFDGSGPVKSGYRKFIIRTVPGQSDVDSLAEVLNRRLNHPEWPLPNVFLIDGGRPQVSRVRQVLLARQVAVPAVGIAKGAQRKRNDFILGNKDREFIQWVHVHREFLMRVRDEAHRFAITFHRRRRDRVR